MTGKTKIAAIRIAGGEHEPFYSAKLRMFYYDAGTASNLVVKQVGGLRVLLADAATREVTNGGTHDVHLPLMLRGYVRPQEHGGSGQNHGLELSLEADADTFRGDLITTGPASDVTLTPIGSWPQELEPDIDLPEHRFVAGTVPVQLAASKEGLAKFFKLATKSGQSTLFDGLRLAKPATKTIELTLVPYGIELEGSLPDPTRDLLTPPDPNARITGRFRLEEDDRASGKTSYRLRLVDGERTAMEQLEARIARAFTELANEKDAPLAVRFDRRPDVPPLLFLMEINGKKLGLKKTESGDFEMAIDPISIDARLRTVSRFPGDLPGIAEIHGEYLVWRKQSDGFDVTIDAGPELAADQKIAIAFTRSNAEWTTSLKEGFKEQPVEVPLTAESARLLAIYKAGKVVAAGETSAHYAFFPLNDGWLQLSLGGAKTIKLPKETVRPSAMSGRIVAPHGTSAEGLRGVVVEDAKRLLLKIKWRMQDKICRPHSGDLEIAQARGRLRGFVFVAETAPTAAEALPDLRRGPAVTRDVPISFNAPQLGLMLKGTFTWKPTGWSLDVTDVIEKIDGDKKIDGDEKAELPGTPAGYGWKAPHERPFITNHPLTRSAVTPAEPSVSRGLLRYSFAGGFTLSNANAGEAPALSLRTSPAEWDGLYNNGTSFRPDTLVLTTLPGAEFTPDGKPLSGKFQSALRHDLSILDELYAWSDPPPPKSQAPNVPTREATIVTALDPAGLEAVWGQNRIRMALTRTQDAFMTGWIEVGDDPKVNITSLVQPYTWKDVKLKVDLTPVWGAYVLAGEDYRLDKALAGLQTEFKVEAGFLVAGDAIRIRGNAANLFKLKGSDLLWDSRGTGFAPAMKDGARPVGWKHALDGELRTLELRTLRKAETIKIDTDTSQFPWMKDTPLAFFVRDLPVENAIFDGTENPVESAVGVTGQAFNRDAFLKSLHEWRLFEDVAKPKLKPFDLRFGPFLFSPSRLKRVEFDSAGEVKLIAVIGGLRIGHRAEDPSSLADQGPFGADRIYERADLFCLTLTRNGDKWTPGWSGVKLKENEGSLVFDARPPKVTCSVLLEVDSKGIQSVNDAKVDATIELDIVSKKVQFGARLFGRPCAFSADATIGAGLGFTITTSGVAATASIVLLRVDKLEVELSVDKPSMRLHGALLLMPSPIKAADDATALAFFSPDPAAFRWLDLSAGETTTKKSPLAIDHASGQINAEWDGIWAKPKPLFGLQTAGAWQVHAKIAAFVAGEDTLKALAPLPIGSAWGRIAGFGKSSEKSSETRIDHRLMLDADTAEHHLELSWHVSFPSPVRWPVNGLRQTDGKPVPAAWLTPQAADSTKSGRSRKVKIETGDALTHHVTMRLKRHSIEASGLRRSAGRILPRAPISLLAAVEHALVHDKRKVTWATLDHVTITSLHLMTDLAEHHAFAARYRVGTYRGAETESKTPHPGIVEVPWAVSGFFDEGLIRFYRSAAFKQEFDTPLFLGGAAVLLPYSVDEGPQQTVAGVIPWVGLSEAMRVPFGYLTQSGGQWEVAAPDLWSGSAYTGALSQRTIVMSRQADAAQALSDLANAGLVTEVKNAGMLARVLPVEQLFFENLRDGSKGQLEVPADAPSNDIVQAPFFLRALLAIQARWNATRWNATDDPAAWQALSLHPARGKERGTRANPAAGVELKQLPAPTATGMQVPADLIALSHLRAERQAAYRLIDASLAEESGDRQPRAELVDRARDLDRFAQCAIREVDRDGDLPALVIVTVPRSLVVRGGRSGIVIDHPVLAPSPSLGWPTSKRTSDLDKLAPRLGEEFPVQSPEAGFAARFRQIGLPGGTRPVMTYLDFAHRVAFDRDVRVPFNGPAARHLSPVNTRLRTPTSDNPADEATSVAPAGSSASATPAAAESSKPTLVPFVELATIGRRPGVFEVVTAAVTVVADDKPLDPHHARFGYPANSGPVVAHQLRTPRSPALPDDAADFKITENLGDILKFRRRTFLSLADGTPTGAAANFVLDKFGEFAGNADVLRREVKGKYLRVAMSLKDAAALIGPDWTGRLTVNFTASAKDLTDPKEVKDVANPTAELEDMIATRTVRLEVGPASFAMRDAEKPVVAFPSFDWKISADELLPAAQEALRHATADTPIRLVITFGADRPLSEAPKQTAILPLALDPGNRRVLKTGTQTIAFGDPSYDRQLGSSTEGDIKQIDAARVLLSVDRQEYDRGATLYFACGEIDPASGLFSPNPSVPGRTYWVRFRRLGKPNPDGTSRAPDDLVIAGIAPDAEDKVGYIVKQGTPYEVPLQLLRYVRSETINVSPLEPGDRLEISANLKDASGQVRIITLFVNIVAAPVIAPPPCVYSVIDSTKSPVISRVVLHAAAPLPQHIEFPSLKDDLAKGYVNRRALFVWRFVRIGQVDTDLELVKYDRSGGAQLPRP